MNTVTRRAAVAFIGLAGAGAFAYGGSWVACRFVDRSQADFFALLDMVPDTASARLVGERMLASGGDPAALIARLSGREGVRKALATGCPQTREALVRGQCAKDFAARRTVTIEGWVLSQTEAELCAAARALRA